MSTQPPSFGSVYDIRGGVASGEPTSIAHSAAVEVTTLRVARGQQKPTYAAPGEVVIYCIEGEAIVRLRGKECRLAGGQLTHFTANEPQSVEAVQDSVLLILSVPQRASAGGGAEARQRGGGKSGDAVQEASEESFPASDAPGWTPVTSS